MEGLSNRGELRDIFDISHLGENVMGANNLSPVFRQKIGGLLRQIRPPRNEEDWRRRFYHRNAPTQASIVESLQHLARGYQ